MIDLSRQPVGTRVLIECPDWVYDIEYLGPGPNTTLEVRVTTADPEFMNEWRNCLFVGSVHLSLEPSEGLTEHLFEILPFGRMTFVLKNGAIVTQTEPVLSAVLIGKDYEYEVFKT